LDATVSASLGLDGAGAKNRPVAKVMTLLRDMLNELEQEAKSDEEVYDKLACWCETNDKEKAKSISDAEKKIKGLTNKIDELTATSARLNTEIENLEKEVAENQEALSKATALREKQLEEFSAEEKDLLESISSLKAAVDALSKHNGEGASSLLQVRRDPVRQVADTIRHEMQRHATMLSGVLSHKERRATASFLQSPQEPYAPQSGEIFGVLQTMKETFESNLDNSQKEEMANQKAYEELKTAKEAEISAGKGQIETKTQEVADADEKNARAKEDLEDTRSSLSADEEFLSKLKEKCAMTDKEWEERQKARQLEVEAVSKALEILSGDEAHDIFSRSFNPSLLQATRASRSERREQASRLLVAAGRKLHSPRLATLAYRVRLDAFTKVKKAIDDLVAQLLKEKEEEIKKNDWCVEEFNTNQLQTEKKDREKQDLIAKIEDLELTIKTIADAIAKLKAEITEMQVQLKRASEDREKESREFQQTVADQRASQKLLQKCLKVLEGFYEKEAAAALVQRQEPAGPPPPPGFDAYKKNEASGGVMALIRQIISDAEAMEAEAIKSEDDAQGAYEDFLKETNASIEAKVKEISNKDMEKAKAEAELVETKEAKEEVVVELEELSSYNAELHQSCDYVMKNFEVRQTARDEEVEALKQAKAILSGAKFEEFLQSAQ